MEEEEIAVQYPLELLAAGLLVALLLVLLVGCDGEVERQQREAEFNAKFVHACLPKIGEPITARWEAGVLLCYPHRSKKQPAVVANRDELP